MKNFLVSVSVNDPYAKSFDYREKAGKVEVAIARALRKFRAEQWKGRPLKEVSVKGVYLMTASAE